MNKYESLYSLENLQMLRFVSEDDNEVAKNQSPDAGTHRASAMAKAEKSLELVNENLLNSSTPSQV
jgi:hypothetical protein